MYDETYNGTNYKSNDVWYSGYDYYGYDYYGYDYYSYYGYYDYYGSAPGSHIPGGSIPGTPPGANAGIAAWSLNYTGNPNFAKYEYVDPEAILDEKCPKPPTPEPPAPAPPPETPTPPAAPVSDFDKSLDNFQTVLEVGGFVPGPIGTAADVTNGMIHLARGNFREAAWSFVGAIPIAGDYISGARKAAKAAKTGDKTGDVAKGTTNALTDTSKTTNKLREGAADARAAKSPACMPGSSACFTEGTQIVVGVTYNEELCTTTYVTSNIEDIKVGDFVYSYDTITGEVSQKEVTATFVRESDHLDYLTIVDADGNEQVIETTDSHPFWVVTENPELWRAAQEVVNENGTVLYHENLGITADGYWVEAKDLKEGDVFLGANGELSVLVAQERVTFADGITVYNFTVDGNHDYFVIAQTAEYGQTCVLVHNASKSYDISDINRSNSRAKGIPDKEIGPSGLPKIHAPQMPTRKAAKEAAQNAAGKGGTVMEHTNPKVGNAHFHSVKPNGAKQRIHYEYPD